MPLQQSHQEMGHELMAMALRTAPGAVMSALTLNNVVALLTAIFLFVQILYLIWKWRREWRHAANNRKMAKLAEERRNAE